MTARRRMLLPVGFLAAAIFLADSGLASAQRPGVPAPGEHVPLGPRYGKRSLSPEQVREALQRLGGGSDIPPELQPLAEELRKKFAKDSTIDPKKREEILRRMFANPDAMKQLEEFAKQKQATGKEPSPEQLGDLLKQLSGKAQPGLPPGRFNPPPMPPPDGPDIPVRPEPKPGGPDRVEPPPPPQGADPAPMDPAARRSGPTPPVPEPGMPPTSPFDAPFDADETPRERAMRTAATLWERNFGPLEETPAVKRALADLVEGTADLKDSKGNNFWDSMAKESGDSETFADFFNDVAGGGNWSLPDIDVPSLGWGRSNTDIGRGDGSGGSWWSRGSRGSRSGGGSGGSGSGFGMPGLEGSWLPVVVLAALLIGGLLVWRFWYLRDQPHEAGLALGGLGPWPVDPRRIATRKDVVVAFEYLSVLICGPSAKTWTHSTIAGALADLAATHGETAAMLARLYELARYAPVEEPLTTAELAEARRLVCRLAGLGYE